MGGRIADVVGRVFGRAPMMLIELLLVYQYRDTYKPLLQP